MIVKHFPIEVTSEQVGKPVFGGPADLTAYILEPVENSLVLLQALRKAGVNGKAHLYPVGPHGIGLGTEETQGVNGKYLEPYCESWIELAIRWIKMQL